MVVVIAMLVAPSSGFGATFASEAALSATGDPDARGTFIYDPGQNDMIGRAELLQPALVSYYVGKGFDRNFLAWAPTRSIDPGAADWSYCPGGPHAGQLCPVAHAFNPVRDLVDGNITTVAHGGAFIALVCGNFSRNPVAGPMPRITGVKYEDMNGDGDRDAGEPGRAGWTIRLRHGGKVVATTTTGAGGAYSFTLNANNLKFGPGVYRIEEVQKAGWVASDAPAPVNVPPGAGNTTFSGNDFGNYRPPVIGGHKFDDPDVDGVWDAGDPGLAGWTIGLASGPSTVTAADGSYSFTVAPGSYTVQETLQTGWRQTAPAPPGTHSFTVRSGDVIDDADFGNVCLGATEVNPIDDSTGDPLAGLEVRIDEVSVPGILANDPSLPRTTTGTPTFDDLLPGTYEVTAFLPDGVFTTDPDAVVVDGRFAIVKEIDVEACETTQVPISLFTQSTPGLVTGGVTIPLATKFATSGFRFMARDPDRVSGTLQFNDHDTKLNLHSADIEALDISGNAAIVWGQVEIDGAEERFRLRLVDAGEPGDDDRYELTVANGYMAGFGTTLDGGNVQVHGR